MSFWGDITNYLYLHSVCFNFRIANILDVEIIFNLTHFPLFCRMIRMTTLMQREKQWTNVLTRVQCHVVLRIWVYGYSVNILQRYLRRFHVYFLFSVFIFYFLLSFNAIIENVILIAALLYWFICNSIIFVTQSIYELLHGSLDCFLCQLLP